MKLKKHLFMVEMVKVMMFLASDSMYDNTVLTGDFSSLVHAMYREPEYIMQIDLICHGTINKNMF
jgi:hypothetical protein